MSILDRMIGEPRYLTPSGKTWLCKIAIHGYELIYPFAELLIEHGRYKVLTGPFIEQCRRCGKLKLLKP